MKRPLKGGRYTRAADTGKLTKTEAATKPVAAPNPSDAPTKARKGKSK